MKNIVQMREKLLAYYDAQGRALPWRIRPEDRAKGAAADPYAVWLSEIIMQQTTIPHGTPYWIKFLEKFPKITDLANAERDTVLAMWAGLGYYARARNLHKCAQIIRDEHGGVFPKTEAELLKLPGVGPYTAATIAAICFDEVTNIVDGNVERVISRLFAVEAPLPKGRKDIRACAALIATPENINVLRPGDYGQALMDLGGTVCTPKSPKCEICPWTEYCAAYKAGKQTDYPRKIKKVKSPVRKGAVFVTLNNGRILLRRRPDKGLLGGMMGFPTTQWGDLPSADDIRSAAPFDRNWEKLDASVRHVFTHFELHLDVYRAEISSVDRGVMKTDGVNIWALLDEIDDYALPTVMRKALKIATDI